jgi:hypothetical protein
MHGTGSELGPMVGLGISDADPFATLVMMVHMGGAVAVVAVMALVVLVTAVAGVIRCY